MILHQTTTLEDCVVRNAEHFVPCYQGAIHDRGDGLCYTAVEGSVLADCKDDSMIDEVYMAIGLCTRCLGQSSQYSVS